ncbi:MAG: hypothetical protein NT106_09795 [Candidatus Sumerlaeota bacterium]|nr:hypothetical protein [Candidatus Sumerlaeota bacterium]
MRKIWTGRDMDKPVTDSWRIESFGSYRRVQWGKRDYPPIVILFLLTLLFMAPVVPLNVIGYQLHAGDATIFSFILGWGADTWWHAPLRYMDAPFFYPHKGALATTEALILQSILMTPVWLLSHNFVLTYNISLYIATFLTLLAMYATLRILTPVPRGACIAAAVIATVTTDRYWHIVGHLNLLWTGILALGFLAGWMLSAGSGRRPVLIAVVTGISSFLFSLYLFIFTAFCLLLGVLSGAIFIRHERRDFRALLIRLLQTGVLILILASPIVFSYTRAKGRSAGGDIGRGTVIECARNAATLGGWIFPPAISGRLKTLPATLLPRKFQNSAPTEDCQYAGVILLLLLILEMVRLFRRAMRRRLETLDRLSIFCLTVALACLVLSLGPYEGNWKMPYYYLHVLVLRLTGFFRNPSRFAFMFQIFSAFNAAIFLTALGGRRKRTVELLSAILVAGVFLEHFPVEMTPRYAPVPIQTIKELDRHDPSRHEPLLFLPDPGNCSTGFSLYPGWRPMVNGFFSSALFGDYDEFFNRLDDFPTTRSLAWIDRIGVRWIILMDPQLIMRAKGDAGLKLEWQSGNSALARIANPEEIRMSWEEERIRMQGALLKERRRVPDKIFPVMLADFTRGEMPAQTSWKADIFYIPGKGLQFEPKGRDFGSFTMTLPMPLPTALFDGLEIEFTTSLNMQEAQLYVFWAGSKPVSSRRMQVGRIIRGKEKGAYLALVPLYQHPDYYTSGNLNSLRIDFANLPPVSNRIIYIREVRMTRLKEMPPVPF